MTLLQKKLLVFKIFDCATYQCAIQEKKLHICTFLYKGGTKTTS